MPRHRPPRRPRHKTSMPAVVTRSTAYRDLPQYLTVAEVCTVLSLGKTTVYDLIRRGDLPARRFGRALRVPRAALRGLGIIS